MGSMGSIGSALALVVLLPFAAAVLNLLLPVAARKALVLVVLAAGLVAIVGAFGSPPEDVRVLGATALALDGLSLFALAFIYLLGTIIFVFCLKGLDRRAERAFLVLYPLAVSFAAGAVLCPNTFGFLILWGMSGLVLYGFALLGTGERAAATAKKTILIVGGGDAFLILGLALIGATTSGTFAEAGAGLSHAGGALGFVCVLAAALAKAGGFPLHTWVPDLSRDAPAEAAALLPASLDKLLGIYLLARMTTGMFELGLAVRMTLVSLGALTVIVAVMMALAQHNGRRLLGYHAVSQVGYMIMGVSSGVPLAFAGGLFHLANNTIYKSALFLSLGSVEKRAGTGELDDLGGLARTMPATFVPALIAALSISGLPPFNGFFSKWMIYQGLLEQARTLAPAYAAWLLVCLVLALFGSALTLASFIKFLHAVFLGRRPEALTKVEEAPANQWLATGALAVLCVGFGLFARAVPLKLLILPAAKEAGLDAGVAAPALYSPLLVGGLLGLAFVLGLAVYLLTRKVRYDEAYLGGNAPAEAYRASGAEFYKEVVEMRPLRTLYRRSEEKAFDVYDQGARATLGLSRLLQKAHPGLLPVYGLFILFGILLLLILARGQ